MFNRWNWRGAVSQYTTYFPPRRKEQVISNPIQFSTSPNLPLFPLKVLHCSMNASVIFNCWRQKANQVALAQH
jgi:hypothetical protein